MNENVKRWLENQDLQNFIRQVQVDIYVGMKNGVSEREVNWALFDLLNAIDNKVRPVRMEKGPDGKWVEKRMSKSLS